jgi:hypothetical protein
MAKILLIYQLSEGGGDPIQVHQCYERLVYDVQSLETMGKLERVNGNVPLTVLWTNYPAFGVILSAMMTSGKSGIS